ERLVAPGARPQAPELWAAAYVLLGLRYDKEFARAILREVLGMKESTTYQAIVAEGLAEGRVQGRAEEARRVLLLPGGGQVRAPADATTRAAVEAIGEVERLEELIRRVSRVGSWQELLAAAARPRGHGRRKGKGGGNGSRRCPGGGRGEGDARTASFDPRRDPAGGGGGPGPWRPTPGRAATT